MSKKQTIHLISYKNSPNIGDNFQTLATKHVLEQLGYNIQYVDRDEKDTDEEKIIFINGYYSPKTIKNLNFDFSEKSKVIFYNIHLAGDNGRIHFLKTHFLGNQKIYNTLKKFEPIGCRDVATKDLLQSFDVKAVNNECITLLLDKRTSAQSKKAQKVILVDVDEFVPLPRKYRKDIEYRSQIIPGGENLSNQEKLAMSKEILEYYKENAKLVVTSRFHCAMPCIAMGIPVIFFGDTRSKRCEGVKKYVQYYDYIHCGFRTITHLKKLSRSDKVPLLSKKIKYDFNIIDVIYNIMYKLYLHLLYMSGVIKIDWNVDPVDIEEQKAQKISLLKEKLSDI